MADSGFVKHLRVQFAIDTNHSLLFSSPFASLPGDSVLQIDQHLICLSEKAMAPHSSTLAWRIPWAEEPGGLPSMGSHRVRRDSSDLAAVAICLSLGLSPDCNQLVLWLTVVQVLFPLR